jgi:hypothetical protein
MRGLYSFDDRFRKLVSRRPRARPKPQNHTVIGTEPCRDTLAGDVVLLDDYPAITP